MCPAEDETHKYNTSVQYPSKYIETMNGKKTEVQSLWRKPCSDNFVKAFCTTAKFCDGEQSGSECFSDGKWKACDTPDLGTKQTSQTGTQPAPSLSDTGDVSGGMQSTEAPQTNLPFAPEQLIPETDSAQNVGKQLESAANDETGFWGDIAKWITGDDGSSNTVDEPADFDSAFGDPSRLTPPQSASDQDPYVGFEPHTVDTNTFGGRTSIRDAQDLPAPEIDPNKVYTMGELRAMAKSYGPESLPDGFQNVLAAGQRVADNKFADPDMLAALSKVHTDQASEYGNSVPMTDMGRSTHPLLGKLPTNTTNAHALGQGVDFQVRGVPLEQQAALVERLQNEGFTKILGTAELRSYMTENGYDNPVGVHSARQTGPHIHAEFRGGATEQQVAVLTGNGWPSEAPATSPPTQVASTNPFTGIGTPASNVAAFAAEEGPSIFRSASPVHAIENPPLPQSRPLNDFAAGDYYPTLVQTGPTPQVSLAAADDYFPEGATVPDWTNVQIYPTGPASFDERFSFTAEGAVPAADTRSPEIIAMEQQQRLDRIAQAPAQIDPDQGVTRGITFQSLAHGTSQGRETIDDYMGRLENEIRGIGRWSPDPVTVSDPREFAALPLDGEQPSSVVGGTQSAPGDTIVIAPGAERDPLLGTIVPGTEAGRLGGNAGAPTGQPFDTGAEVLLPEVVATADVPLPVPRQDSLGNYITEAAVSQSSDLSGSRTGIALPRDNIVDTWNTGGTALPRDNVVDTWNTRGWALSGSTIVDGWNTSGVPLARDNTVDTWSTNGSALARDNIVDNWTTGGASLPNATVVDTWNTGGTSLARDNIVDTWGTGGTALPRDNMVDLPISQTLPGEFGALPLDGESPAKVSFYDAFGNPYSTQEAARSADTWSQAQIIAGDYRGSEWDLGSEGVRAVAEYRLFGNDDASEWMRIAAYDRLSGQYGATSEEWSGVDVDASRPLVFYDAFGGAHGASVDAQNVDSIDPIAAIANQPPGADAFGVDPIPATSELSRVPLGQGGIGSDSARTPQLASLYEGRAFCSGGGACGDGNRLEGRATAFASNPNVPEEARRFSSEVRTFAAPASMGLVPGQEYTITNALTGESTTAIYNDRAGGVVLSKAAIEAIGASGSAEIRVSPVLAAADVDGGTASIASPSAQQPSEAASSFDEAGFVSAVQYAYVWEPQYGTYDDYEDAAGTAQVTSPAPGEAGASQQTAENVPLPQARPAGLDEEIAASVVAQRAAEARQQASRQSAGTQINPNAPVTAAQVSRYYASLQRNPNMMPPADAAQFRMGMSLLGPQGIAHYINSNPALKAKIMRAIGGR